MERMTPPMKMAKVVSMGRYMPTETSMGLFTCIMIMAMPIRMPTPTRGQAMSPPTMPCARTAIKPACGAESWRSPKPVPPARMLPCWSSSSGQYMTALATTTAISSVIWMYFGRAAEDVADFEILQQFAGDGGRDADDGGDPKHGGDAADAGDAHGDQEQGGDEQGGEGQAGDRVIGGADHADQVARDGGEEEAHDEHDDAGDQRHQDLPRQVEVEDRASGRT